MRAFLKNYRQSPRKVRLAATYIKGKQATSALAELSMLNKRAGDPLAKLLASAMANAKNNGGVDEQDLYVKDIRVDQGVTLRRSRPRSRGMSNPIRKRSSHVTVVLEERKHETRSTKSEKTKTNSKKQRTK